MTKEQVVYFSTVLCIALPEFHLTSECSPPGMCALVLPLVVEAELPPLENYLHEDELGSQDIRVHCIATIKWLGAWLHRVNMTTQFNEAKANSPCSHNHELGALPQFFSDAREYWHRFEAHPRLGGGRECGCTQGASIQEQEIAQRGLKNPS